MSDKVRKMNTVIEYKTACGYPVFRSSRTKKMRNTTRAIAYSAADSMMISMMRLYVRRASTRPRYQIRNTMRDVQRSVVAKDIAK